MLLPDLIDRSSSFRHTDIQARTNLDPSRQSVLRRSLGEVSWAEYRAILSDADPELRAEALLNFARRQEVAGNTALASEFYQNLSESSEGIPSAIGRRARSHLDAILGIGAAGGRAEFLLRRLATEACDPAGLTGMVLAGGVFRLTRLATLSRLAANPSLGIFSRGMLARATAATAAFALEAPTFTLGTRAAHQILGREVDWSRESLGRDLASSYLVLGGLKVAGWASGAAYRGLAGTSPRSLPLQVLFQQGGMLAGISFGHWLESEAGLRPRLPGATTMVDSLAMLLQFHVAGGLAAGALGEGFQHRERALDLQTEALSRSLPRLRLPGLSLEPQPAFAFSGANAEAAREAPGAVHDLLNGLQIMQMSIFKDGKSPERPAADARASGVVRSAEPRVTEAKLEADVDFFLRGVDNPELGLRAFLDSLPIAAAVARIKGIDGFGRIFVINNRFTDLFGFSEREAGQHPITHFFKISSLPMIATRIHTIVHGGVFQATPMDFLSRDGSYRKIWGSGVVRTVYGESFAFGFYEPRDESQNSKPAINPALKNLQAADGTRLPSLNREGRFELRNTIELSMQLANADSPLMRHFANNDLSVSVQIPQGYSTHTYIDSLTQGLNALTQRSNIATGRRFSLTLLDAYGSHLGTHNWVKNARGFEMSNDASPIPPSAVRVSAAAIPPPPARMPARGLFAEVSRILDGVKGGSASRTPGEENDPGKKGPSRR